MKRLIVLAVLFACGGFVEPVYPQAVLSEDFYVSASVPYASGIIPTVTKIQYVEGGDDLWLEQDVGTSLQFGELGLNTFIDPVTEAVNNIFLPQHYFAIDVGINGVYPDNGQISISYTDVVNPNAAQAKEGLATHATLTFKKVTITGVDTSGDPIEEETTLGSGKYLLGDLPSGVTFASLRGGWLRLYAGIVNLDPDAAIPDPTGAEPFTPGDLGGAYEGYITLTYAPL